MNIFVTDTDPIIAAQNLADVHVNKMLLESTQLVSNFMHIKRIPNAPYKPTHLQHPCTKWVCSGIHNISWLYQHAVALANEFEYRRSKRHACYNVLKDMILGPYFYKCIIPITELPQPKDFCLCMPEDYIVRTKDLQTGEDITSSNTVSVTMSYQRYYASKKYTMKVPMVWTRRKPPSWLAAATKSIRELYVSS